MYEFRGEVHDAGQLIAMELFATLEEVLGFVEKWIGPCIEAGDRVIRDENHEDGVIQEWRCYENCEGCSVDGLEDAKFLYQILVKRI